MVRLQRVQSLKQGVLYQGGVTRHQAVVFREIGKLGNLGTRRVSSLSGMSSARAMIWLRIDQRPQRGQLSIASPTENRRRTPAGVSSLHRLSSSRWGEYCKG